MKLCFFRARRSVLASVVAATCVPMAAVAQITNPPLLSETVVTATRSEQLLSSALPHTTTITRQEIERSQASDLVTLLQREAGLQRTQTGGIGTNSSLFLRGAAALETLVLIDGIAQNKQDASGAVSLEHIMLDSVERVEIVRGNVSAIYGSGAIGGVIQIFTRVGSRVPTATVSLELGPRAYNKLAGGISANFGDTAFSANVSRLKTDGFSAINAAQQPGANPDADSYANTLQPSRPRTNSPTRITLASNCSSPPATRPMTTPLARPPTFKTRPRASARQPSSPTTPLATGAVACRLVSSRTRAASSTTVLLDLLTAL